MSLNDQVHSVYSSMSKLIETKDLIEFQQFLYKWFNSFNFAVSLESIQSYFLDVQKLSSLEVIAKELICFIDTVEDSELLEATVCPYVGTIHSVKGLEFETVVLLNVHSKQFKLDSEESLNVYYVGITRAKQSLCIHCCK